MPALQAKKGIVVQIDVRASDPDGKELDYWSNPEVTNVRQTSAGLVGILELTGHFTGQVARLALVFAGYDLYVAHLPDWKVVYDGDLVRISWEVTIA